jgi:hypothetical protein
MRFSLVPAGLAASLALAGCAGTTSSSSGDGSLPQTRAEAPRPSPSPPRLTRDAQGRVVTLADLTGNAPAYGQSMALADSTPGAAALAADEPAASSDFDNLEFVGPGLKDKLVVLRVGAGRTETNLLSVFAGVRNKTGHRLELEMQTLYRDREGRPLSDGHGSWIPITLKPHEETQYRSVALSEEATDFLVRVRPAGEREAASP